MAFSLPTRDFTPAYLNLYRSGELQRRTDEALAELAHCTLCPRACGVNRLAGETGTCHVGRYARVTSYFPHHGEETCLRGRNGSGTIFFAQCNLRCVFCQNYEISQEGCFPETTPDHLAAYMLELQARGCHNINLVTPTHVVAQILEALELAIANGLRLPLVYNSSGYDLVKTLHYLDGIFDIYMPDFKMWDESFAARYLHAPDYPAIARAALCEMHRQVGALKLDEHGLAKRGVLVRHLVMPAGVAGTAAVAAFLATDISPDTYVNLMAQYHPDGQVDHDHFSEINRRISPQEYREALAAVRRAGLHRFD